MKKQKRVIEIVEGPSAEKVDGYSLQEQVRQCKTKAGVPSALEYVDEGISVEFLDRPALTKLRQDLRDGLVTKVVCLDPDCLSIKIINQLIVSEEIERNAELVSDR